MIKELIYEYWESPLPSVIPRDFDFTLISLDLINDILGIRRAGKTYLLFFIILYLTQRNKIDKRATIYINFENRRLYPLKGEYINDIVEVIYSEGLLDRFKRVYLFLDEIQNIENWQQYIRSIYDEFKGRVKIFISGSNRKLLGREYADLLSGRHISLTMYPLSFKEFLIFRGILPKERLSQTKKISSEREASQVKKVLNEYIKHGGLPEVVLSSSKDIILQQYFYDIVTRDVIFKEKIRKDISFLEELALYFITNIARLSSFSRLKDIFCSRGLKISLPTLEHYFRLFENAFLFFSVRIFSYKIKDQFQHPLKLYCIDTGLVNSCGFQFTENLGRLYENIVAIQLKRGGKQIYYWKDYQQHEVDFVIKDRLKISQLIQVSVTLKDETTKRREIRAVLKAARELKCNNLLILNQDEEKQEQIEGFKITFKPLWKWLLET